MEDQLDHLKMALADRYTIEREIGSGGMATVYLAEDLKHRRKVAVKVLRPELAATLGADRFVREIEIAAQLSHPHILPLYDSGEAAGVLYYVMPYVEGESLRERLDREGKLGVDEVIRLTDEIAAALSYAHERGIVHRDVKPENVMLTGGRAVVADFGIARALRVAGGERLTGTGLAVGTPAYMSPEQAMGQADVDARSDVYALGCVVYEMVAGSAPFEGTTPQELLTKHAVERVPSLRTTDPKVPLFLERAVERALAKGPDERFQTASEFARALTAETVVARVGGRRWSRRASIAAIVAVVVGAAAWGLVTVLGGPAYERLAVLPPANLMNDPEQEYFVQGVHNALISELQRAGIAVIARTSVMQYANMQTPIREIANELGVDALIEASVLRAADSVEVQVAVVDGRTQQYVGDRITRRSDLRNVEGLYRGLTAAIASEIQLALTPQTEAHLASARPVNVQAYEAYLKGQSYWQRMARDQRQSREYFQRALLLDSTYAPAHAGIALNWWMGGRRAEANAAINKALALDSTLAEVQHALALIRVWLEWDWEGGEAAFRRAIEINPNYAEARAWYGAFLCYIMERPEEARAQIESALELDPFNPLFRTFNAGLLSTERRYAEAIEELEAVLRIEPDHVVAIRDLVDAYHSSGSYDEALAQIRRQIRRELRGDQEFPELEAFAEALEDALDRGYAEGGYQAALLRYAETIAARWERGEPVAHVFAAKAYAMAGDKERTLEWLEIAYEAHDIMLPGSLPASGFYAVPGDDPRYQALRRRMNLPP
jgi:TolB-like protein/Tfp pilus assembly protein PilF/tRNA A-37 threonylcarbamoyl transferase component Bud32